MVQLITLVAAHLPHSSCYINSANSRYAEI